MYMYMIRRPLFLFDKLFNLLNGITFRNQKDILLFKIIKIRFRFLRCLCNISPLEKGCDEFAKTRYV